MRYDVRTTEKSKPDKIKKMGAKFTLRLKSETLQGLEKLAKIQRTNKSEEARRFIEEGIESALSAKIVGVTNSTAA